MTLTDEQARMLADLDRDMDAGKVAFVHCGGGRVAMQPDVMAHFGLAQGQTISRDVFVAIMHYNIEQVQHEIAMRKRPN